VGGFTAMELLVTIAIAAILMALAAPSFATLIETWRGGQALTAIAFDELGERHAFSIRVPQRQVLSAVDAAAKEAAAC